MPVNHSSLRGFPVTRNIRMTRSVPTIRQRDNLLTGQKHSAYPQKDFVIDLCNTPGVRPVRSEEKAKRERAKEKERRERARRRTGAYKPQRVARTPTNPPNSGGFDSLHTSSCASSGQDSDSDVRRGCSPSPQERGGIIDRVRESASDVTVARAVKSMPDTHSPMTFYSYLQVTDPPRRETLSGVGAASYPPRQSARHFRTPSISSAPARETTCRGISQTINRNDSGW